MSRLVVQGGSPLDGSLLTCGAKNAALPIMAASILAKDVVFLQRVPNISDVRNLIKILEVMGGKVDYDRTTGEMSIDTRSMKTSAPDELVRRMNASFDVAGPLLARYGEAEVALPGGCNLGPRPVDLHLMGFEKMGAQVETDHGQVRVSATKLQGANIVFPIVSVGATKNCMMAATMAEGKTVLENCAREPEIVDLANFLIAMGAKIEGHGTSVIRIEGVKEMHAANYSIVADRIEAGTYLLGAALTNGDLTMEKCVPEHLSALTDTLKEMNQEVSIYDDAVRVKGGRPIKAVDVSTAPYPGFPTDLHPQLVALATLGEGTSTVHETIFSGRFMYVMELVRLGATVKVADRQVVIRGVEELRGAPVDAPDIRAGGALVIAALAANGESTIGGVHFIERGYQDIAERLSGVGAKIELVKEPLPLIES